MRMDFPASLPRRVLAAVFLASAASVVRSGPEPASVSPSAAPYVDAEAIRERFAGVSAADMEELRGKKILFASRSFGLNLYGGLRSLAQQDPKYEFLSSYERFDVFKAGGDLGIIPADVFARRNFVHFLATYWPHTQRVVEVDKLLRDSPHHFGEAVDAVVIFFHTALPQNFEQYAETMDALQRDFPKIRFIYVTAGFMADSRAKDNEQAHAWSEKVRALYRGKAPLYDLGKILSDDFRCGHAYCPEFSKDPAGVHPNLDAGQTQMARGFLLVLRDAFRWQPSSPSASALRLAGGQPRAGSKPAAAALAPTHPDYRAVRAILDANGLTSKKVESVSVVENGRIVRLYLQEGGIRELTDAVGALTALRVLHLYGDPNLPLPRLAKVSPALGRCTALEDLLLNDNELTTLPVELAALTRLTSLSLANNRLGGLPPALRAWAQRFDGIGLARQRP